MPSALQELSSALLCDPQRLVQVHCHRRQSIPWDISLHRHDDLLQMDLTDGFGGILHHDRRHIDLAGTMAMTFYPGVRHGFMLIPPQQRIARYFSLKIRVAPGWRLLTEQPFPLLATRVPDDEGLIEVLTRLERVYAARRHNTLLITALLLELLALWPTTAQHAAHPHGAFGSGRQRDARIEHAIELIEHHLHDPLSLHDLAAEVGLSSRHLTREFTAVVGMSPHAYCNHHRLMSAQEMLVDQRASVTEVAQQLGFPSIHAFSRWFTRLAGMPPSEYRESHQVL